MRRLFLATADTARSLLDHPELAKRWDAPSALERMTVGTLAAHLARAVTVVPGYLDTGGEPPFADAADYFLSIFPQADTDPDSETARAIVGRAHGEAQAGPGRVASSWDEARREVESRLGDEQPDRGLSVRGSTMKIADYLVTRMVELVIHSDDLAASLDVAPPAFVPPVTDAVIGCLTEMAARRYSALAVIRALSRVERADPAVLRVF